MGVGLLDQISQLNTSLFAKCLVCRPSWADLEVPHNDVRFIGVTQPHACDMELLDRSCGCTAPNQNVKGGLLPKSFFTVISLLSPWGNWHGRFLKRRRMKWKNLHPSAVDAVEKHKLKLTMILFSQLHQLIGKEWFALSVTSEQRGEKPKPKPLRHGISRWEVPRNPRQLSGQRR